MKKVKWIPAALAAALIFLLLSYCAGWLLTPPRTSYGSTWDRYLQEPENSVDVLFFGSSLVYCNVAPGIIWEECGITSYAMAGPEQTIPITYSYVKEACRTQTPKVVAIEITGMFYKQYQNYSKVNISYMPWSCNRMEAIFNAAEPELRAGLLFPLFDYHSRWQEVTPSNILTRISPSIDPMAGYTFLTTATAQGEAAYRDYSAETETYARNLDYLKQIHSYCSEQGIQLMLFLTPTKGRIPESERNKLKDDISTLEGVVFADFNDNWDEISINDSTDWYDFLHFNCRGAETFSRYLGQYLTRSLGLPPTQGEDEALWQSRVETFHSRLNDIV